MVAGLTKNRLHQYPDFTVKASAGLIPGVSPFFKFGANYDIDTATTPEDIHTLGGDFLFPTASSTLSVVSTSAQDGVGGTGIRNMTIEGLDSNYNLISEDVILDGINPVVTQKSFLRHHRSYGTLAGSAQVAVGNIIITHSEGDICEILATEGQSLTATYTVPKNHILLLNVLVASIERTNTNSSAEMHFEVKHPLQNVWRIQTSFSVVGAGASSFNRFTNQFFPITEQLDLKVKCESVSVNGSRVSAGFDGFLINLEVFQW